MSIRSQYIDCSEVPLIGIVIAVYNRKERTRECLLSLRDSTYKRLFVCVIDDGSIDGTWEMLYEEFPWVRAIRGNGSLWWTGATNLGLNACLKAGCAYILLLNPDCIVYQDTISILIAYALQYENTMLACTVVDEANPNIIWWAGTKWGSLKYMPIIWLFQYKYKRGQLIQELPNAPFETSDTGGRGVLIPRSILETIGFFDNEAFPHYGADNDFGLRVWENGFKIMVIPHARIRLYIEETGHAIGKSLISLPKRYIQRLLSRKHGEFLRVTWLLLKKHVPWYAIFPSYLAFMLIMSLRYWSISLLMLRKKKEIRVCFKAEENK